MGTFLKLRNSMRALLPNFDVNISKEIFPCPRRTVLQSMPSTLYLLQCLKIRDMISIIKNEDKMWDAWMPSFNFEFHIRSKQIYYSSTFLNIRHNMNAWIYTNNNIIFGWWCSRLIWISLQYFYLLVHSSKIWRFPVWRNTLCVIKMTTLHTQ